MSDYPYLRSDDGQPSSFSAVRERRSLMVPYRQRCLPTHEQQQMKLESLRWRFGGYRNGTRVMRWFVALAKVLGFIPE
jgi:hypothetical protein